MCKEKKEKSTFEIMKIKENLHDYTITIDFINKINYAELSQMINRDSFYYDINHVSVNIYIGVITIIFCNKDTLRRFINEIERKS